MDIHVVNLPEWLLRLLSQTGAAQHIERGHITLASPLPALTIGGLMISALIWFTFFYYRDGTRPSWWVKGPLVILRLLAILALVAMLSQPTLRLEQVDRVRPSIAIIVDN